jgi:hypothetical protein
VPAGGRGSPIVVTTGARARALATLLTTRGWQQVTAQRPPRIGDIADQQRSYGPPTSALSLFHRIRPGGYDLAFTNRDGLVDIELGEEQHFNRCRALTLDITRHLARPWTPAYLDHSAGHVHRLLPGWGTGQRWTNPSAARFFGLPAQAGDFSGVGATRWRQRAFYDSVKDALNNR